MTLLKKLFAHWLAFARRVAAVNTYILLFVFFVLVITPAGLILKLAGKKSPFVNNPKGSTWEKRSGAEDMETQF